MDCFTEFFCEKADETVHFSFDYFKTEKDFDRLQIKSPGKFKKTHFLVDFAGFLASTSSKIRSGFAVFESLLGCIQFFIIVYKL